MTTTRSKISRRGQQIRSVFRRWQQDPHLFARECFGHELTDHQTQVLDLVRRAASGDGPRKISVKSGKGLGKSFTSSLVNLWWLTRYPDTLTVATAPTQRQVKDVWISETRRHRAKAVPWFRDLLSIDSGKVTVAKSPEWQTRTFAATAKENAQGWHQDHLAAFCEEASGIERTILEAVDETLTNDDHLFLLIGNPNERSTYFYDTFYRFDGWANLTLNAEESPIVRKEHIKHIADTYGTDSDIYRVSVLGEFPQQDSQAVFSDEDVVAAMDRDPREKAINLDACEWSHGEVVRQIGIDFARFGGDENVIYIRQGNAIMEWTRMAHVEPWDALNWAHQKQLEYGWPDDSVVYCVDGGGMGQGIIGRARQDGRTIYDFQTQHTAADSLHMSNKMTEAWFMLRNKMRDGRCSIPNDHVLRSQLVTRFYSTDNKSRLLLEPKDTYMRRGPYSSPDRADALCMAYYDPAQSLRG